MEEVSKEKFKEIFLKYGKLSDGYGIDYWNKFYEIAKRENMKYLIKLPSNADERRMMLVSSYSANEYRLFFVSEAQEESLFR